MDKVCEACKTIPPIVATGYEEKGKYETIGDLKCYVAAPSPSPKSGIIFVYDIFGLDFKQTLQGADILALTEPGHVVVIPDYFKGDPLSKENFPPDTEEKKQKLGAFFQNQAAIPKNVEATAKLLGELKQKFPEVKKWGIYGTCWGGKLAITATNSLKEFHASAQAHPAMFEPKDIADTHVPALVLASKDEDANAMKEAKDILEKRSDSGYVTTYSESIHGWMAARSNLENESELKTYEQGYKELVEFFKKHLG